MYGIESPGTLLAAIVGIAMITVFFMMNARLKKISDILEIYSEVEFKNLSTKKRLNVRTAIKNLRLR
jgi:hypothetical protein